MCGNALDGGTIKPVPVMADHQLSLWYRNQHSTLWYQESRRRRAHDPIVTSSALSLPLTAPARRSQRSWLIGEWGMAIQPSVAAAARSP